MRLFRGPIEGGVPQWRMIVRQLKSRGPVLPLATLAAAGAVQGWTVEDGFPRCFSPEESADDHFHQTLILPRQHRAQIDEQAAVLSPADNWARARCAAARSSALDVVVRGRQRNGIRRHVVDRASVRMPRQLSVAIAAANSTSSAWANCGASRSARWRRFSTEVPSNWTAASSAAVAADRRRVPTWRQGPRRVDGSARQAANSGCDSMR